jgi:iron uptake system component EfeO
MRSGFLLGIAATVAVTIVGCNGAAAAAPKAVNAAVTEFKISSDATKVAAGDVTFTISNKGAAIHEFVVVRTDLADDKLPKDAEGLVAEGGPLAAVDEVEDITPGSSKTLTVKLEPGHYVFFCNLAGHYVGGMHGTVEAVASTASN